MVNGVGVLGTYVRKFEGYQIFRWLSAVMSKAAGLKTSGGDVESTVSFSKCQQQVVLHMNT